MRQSYLNAILTVPANIAMRGKIEENWKVGKACLKAGDFNVAASRLYYGVFQAVLYYARRKKSYGPSSGRNTTHSDMLDIVRTFGTGSRLYGNRFKDLMSLRITADYDPDTPPWEEIQEILDTCNDIRNHYMKLAEQ